MAATNSTAPAKAHVSLRLPTYILESIDAHAEKENISRTEAFVFYLQTGLDISDGKTEAPNKDESLFQDIHDELAEIKMMLEAQQLNASQISIQQDSASSTSKAKTKNKKQKEAKGGADSEITSTTVEKSIEDIDEEAPRAAIEELTEEPANTADEQTPAQGATKAALSVKALEKALSSAAKKMVSVEKIWLYGALANAKEISDTSLDLCVKTFDDKKLKSKDLDLLVSTIEGKTGKTANIVLKHAVKDKTTKQALKTKVTLYKAK